MHVTDRRRQTSSGRVEALFVYQVPLGYEVAWPQSGEGVDYRPDLVYSRYFWVGARRVQRKRRSGAFSDPDLDAQFATGRPK